VGKNLANGDYDVLVAGAGAAGLFCAAQAGRRGKRVLVLDHAAKPGAKILISGGGRCNFTNTKLGAENFLSENKHFCKSALARYTAGDFIALIEAAGISYHEKHLGQLFCDHSARDILNLLLKICADAGVEIRTDCPIREVTHGENFTLHTAQGSFNAPAFVVATGGLSIPKMGATGFAYDIARQFGLNIITPRPALVPLTFTGEISAWMEGMAGVSFEAIVRFGKQTFREAVLFTHRGLSGPAILQISSYLPAGAALAIDMLPGANAYETLLAAKAARPKAELKTILAEHLPARLAHGILQPPLTNRPIGDLPNKALQATAHTLNHLTLTPAGTEGFAKAEVTAGGVDTNDLSSQTMQAQAVPGLYFIGEAVDVTGWLGGYNFQWAWSSAYAAAMAV